MFRNGASGCRVIHHASLTREALPEDELYARWAAFLCDEGVPRDAAIAQASLLADAFTLVLASSPSDPMTELSTPLSDEVDFGVTEPSIDS